MTAPDQVARAYSKNPCRRGPSTYEKEFRAGRRDLERAAYLADGTADQNEQTVMSVVEKPVRADALPPDVIAFSALNPIPFTYQLFKLLLTMMSDRRFANQGAGSMARTAAALPSGRRTTDFISLGVIAKTFPIAKVREVLAETGKSSVRQRELPAHVMVYYVIAMALFMNASCREVLRCLLEGLQWLKASRRRSR